VIFLIEGSIVALITPFDNESNVDYVEIKRLCKYHLDNKTDGLCILGTTAEAESLTDSEKVKIVECVTKEIDGKIPIIVGIINNIPDKVIQLANMFEKYNIDAFLVISPYYIKTNETGLIKHFSYIADNVFKPIIIYNVPSRCGINIPYNVLHILSLHKNIVGIKEASGDFKYQTKVASLISDKFRLYSGDDHTILASLGLNASGYITVIGNAFPKEMSDIYHNYKKDNKISLKLYYELLSLIDAVYLDVNPIGIKYLMYIIGFNMPKYRRPLDDASRHIKRQIEEECYKYLI
jgi:4-hydroxy-tetrahydrodipicolinate synthase